LKKLAYLAKPWKKFAYLTEFGPKPPVPGSKEKAGWPDTWADWGKLGNPRNPKIQKLEEVGPGLFCKILEEVCLFYRIYSEASGNRLQKPGWLARKPGLTG